MVDRRKFIRNVTALGLLSGPAFSMANTIGPKARYTGWEYSNQREHFYLPEERIYLNTGSLGPSPRAIVDGIRSNMVKLESNPVVENWGPLGRSMELVREIVGGLLNADKEDIILTRNTTEGLSLIGQTLHLESGEEILTTTREHGGGLVGFEYICERDGAVMKKVEIPMPAHSRQQVIDAVVSGITDRTRVVLLSHVNTVTGLVMPLEEISEVCREKNIWLIADGAQAPGMVPVDVEKLGVHAYASSGHKWLLGPKETGFLYLNKDLQEVVKPVFTSKGYASYSASSGTRNVALIIGLGHAIYWHASYGPEKVREHSYKLREYCRQKLKEIEGIRILSPSDPEICSGIISFELLQSKNTEVAGSLREKEIIIKVLPEPNALRVSCHIFLEKSDIDKFIHELKGLV